MSREKLPTESSLRFGYAIELRRTMLRLKRRDLADAAELSYPYVSEIEKGTKEPSAKSLRQLAAALSFHSTSELMQWAESQELPPEPGSEQHTLDGARDPSRRTSIRATRNGPPHLAMVGTGAWGFQDTPPSPPSQLATEEAAERLARRVVDEVVNALRQEIPRLVEAEVARQLAKLPEQR